MEVEDRMEIDEDSIIQKVQPVVTMETKQSRLA